MADRIFTPCNVARSWHWFRQVTAPCNVACGSGIVTVNSRSGSTLQCDTWLWDDMPLNSLKRPPYRNSTSGFDFDHITAVDMSFCTSLTTLGRKKWRHVYFQDGESQPSCILWIFEKPNYNLLNCSLSRKSRFCIFASRSKMADLRHLGFYGSRDGFSEKPMCDFL